MRAPAVARQGRDPAGKRSQREQAARASSDGYEVHGQSYQLSGGSWRLRGELTGSRSRATDSRSIGFAPTAPGKAPQLVPPPAVR